MVVETVNRTRASSLRVNMEAEYGGIFKKPQSRDLVAHPGDILPAMKMRLFKIVCLLILCMAALPSEAAPLRVGVAGLVHGHIIGFFDRMKGRTDFQVVGIAEPEAQKGSSE